MKIYKVCPVLAAISVKTIVDAQNLRNEHSVFGGLLNRYEENRNAEGYTGYNGYQPPGDGPNFPGNGYGTPNYQGNRYSTNSRPANPYGSALNIISNHPGVEVDNWHNITMRINHFFKNKFPKRQNGQSTYHDIEILTCYGCWCNRGEFFGRGMGEPRDPFDALCKFHHQAYECISIDAENRGETCDPHIISEEGFNFKMDLSFNNGRGGMNLQCDHEQDWCRQRTCEVDLQYIKDFVRTALAGHRVRRDLYGHDDHRNPVTGLPTGYFDMRTECPLGGSLHTPYKKCCGAYPRRRVFKTDTLEEHTGMRLCCDIENGDNVGATQGEVYYPETQVCCGKHGIQQGSECNLYDMNLD